MVSSEPRHISPILITWQIVGINYVECDTEHVTASDMTALGWP